ncbi:hypothetical protein [Streptomyces sp. NPDC050704]|uniref:hypothetical protein n=1 Tax=Streptomyces sp. NPDC050704 TaxID=3157219 RepID=UPI00342C2D04
MGASAAVVCVGGVLAASGNGSDGPPGYVAVERPLPSGAVAPTGDVALVPLKEPSATPAPSAPNSPAESGSSGTTDAPGSGSGSSASGATAVPEAPGSGRTTSPSGGDSGPTSGSSGPGSGAGTGPGTGTPARPAEPEPGPAALSVGDPERKPADKRWCEKVTVGFHNTGGTTVRSGTVTFGTHIIGALGIDWATIKSTEKLPAPIAPGAKEKKTWTVCVEAWRVPLGMHVETQDVEVKWK